MKNARSVPSDALDGPRPAGRSVVVMSPGGGHIQRLLSLVAALTSRGITVYVMTRGQARAAVEAAGGAFVDLFARYPVEAADAESIPISSRFVACAAAYAERLVTDVARLRPALLVYDSFIVVAPLIARRLGIPYVSMRSGHAQVPARAVAAARADAGVRISARCLSAVERLRTEYGMADVHPFSYLEGVSPYLNLYPEPPAFLDADARGAFAPIAFFGSLAPDLRDAMSDERPLRGRAGTPRIYVSFGTVIWWQHAALACSALETLVDVFSGYPAEVLVSLGNHRLDGAERRRLERPRVRVEPYVDQWGALKDADVFVTHHGLNSTHEAIFHGVPMLSYPFLADQPALARRCQQLGLAAALTAVPRAPLDPRVIRRALDGLLANRGIFAERLAEARTWEIDVMQARPAVLDRMLALAADGPAFGDHGHRPAGTRVPGP